MHVGKNFTGLGSGRRYIASNFTDVIVNTQLNMSGIQNSAANTLLLKRNIPMPMKGLKGIIYLLIEWNSLYPWVCLFTGDTSYYIRGKQKGANWGMVEHPTCVYSLVSAASQCY